MQLAYSGGQTSQLTDNQQTTQSSQAAQYLQAAADAQKANKKKDDGSSDDLGAVLGATVKGVSNLVLKDATTRNGYPYGYSSYDTTSARSAVNNNNVGTRPSSLMWLTDEHGSLPLSLSSLTTNSLGDLTGMSTSSGNAGGSGLMPTNCLTAGLGCPMADAHAPPGSATGGATANNGVSAAGTGGGVNRYPTNYRAASQGITGGYSTGTRRTSSSYYPSTLSSSDGTLSDYYNTYGSSSGSSSLTSARLRALYASQAGGLGTSSDS